MRLRRVIYETQAGSRKAFSVYFEARPWNLSDEKWNKPVRIGTKKLRDLFLNS